MEEIKKSRTGIHQGLVPVYVEYEVPAGASNVKGKKRNSYVVTRRQWVVPGNALKQVKEGREAGGKKVKIDEEVMGHHGLSIPPPSDPKRIHIHDFVKKPHEAGLKHEERKAHKASMQEIEDYWKLYHNDRPEKVEDRLHAHAPYNNVHQASKIHSDELSQIEHRNEKIKFERNIFEDKKNRNFLEDSKLNVSPVKLNFRGEHLQGQKYSKGKLEAYIFEWRDKVLVHTSKNGYQTFSGRRPYNEALKYIETLFSPENFKKELFDLRKSIIDKIDFLKAEDPDAKMNQNIVLNKFKSGEDEVSLVGKDGKYQVSVNSSPIISTEDFPRAISKYYSLISNTIDAQGKDKDMSLEIFGERVLQTNRAIRPLVEHLGDKKAALFLFEFSYDILDFPFKEEEFIKAGIPSMMQIAGLPIYTESNAGTDLNGNSPSREIDETLGQEDKRKTQQAAIKATVDRGIKPVLITS